MLFTSREFQTSFSDKFPVSLLLIHDEFVNRSSLCSWNNSLNQLLTFIRVVNHVLDILFSDSSICDIIHDSIVEQNTILRDDSNMRSQIFQCHFHKNMTNEKRDSFRTCLVQTQKKHRNANGFDETSHTRPVTTSRNRSHRAVRRERF